MKVIFYRHLIYSHDELSPTEKIVYSFLVSKSVLHLDDVFDKDGQHIDIDEPLYFDDESYVDIFKINNCKLSNILGITRRTIITCYEHLAYYGYINDDKILISKQMIKEGYFELVNNDNLSGELWIFYSYLKDRAAYCGGTIYGTKAKLADDYHSTLIAITKLMNRLYKLNLIKRIDNNKITITENGKWNN